MKSGIKRTSNKIFTCANGDKVKVHIEFTKMAASKKVDRHCWFTINSTVSKNRNYAAEILIFLNAELMRCDKCAVAHAQQLFDTLLAREAINFGVVKNKRPILTSAKRVTLHSICEDLVEQLGWDNAGFWDVKPIIFPNIPTTLRKKTVPGVCWWTYAWNTLQRMNGGNVAAISYNAAEMTFYATISIDKDQCSAVFRLTGDTSLPVVKVLSPREIEVGIPADPAFATADVMEYLKYPIGESLTAGFLTHLVNNCCQVNQSYMNDLFIAAKEAFEPSLTFVKNASSVLC